MTEWEDKLNERIREHRMELPERTDWPDFLLYKKARERRQRRRRVLVVAAAALPVAAMLLLVFLVGSNHDIAPAVRPSSDIAESYMEHDENQATGCDTPSWRHWNHYDATIIKSPNQEFIESAAHFPFEAPETIQVQTPVETIRFGFRERESDTE